MFCESYKHMLWLQFQPSTSFLYFRKWKRDRFDANSEMDKFGSFLWVKSSSCTKKCIREAQCSPKPTFIFHFCMKVLQDKSSDPKFISVLTHWKNLTLLYFPTIQKSGIFTLCINISLFFWYKKIKLKISGQMHKNPHSHLVVLYSCHSPNSFPFHKYNFQLIYKYVPTILTNKAQCPLHV